MMATVRYVGLGLLAFTVATLAIVATAAAQGSHRPPPQYRPREIRCESESRRSNYCPTHGQGRVRLQRQLSKTRCREYDTWGSIATAAASGCGTGAAGSSPSNRGASVRGRGQVRAMATRPVRAGRHASRAGRIVSGRSIVRSRAGVGSSSSAGSATRLVGGTTRGAPTAVASGSIAGAPRSSRYVEEPDHSFCARNRAANSRPSSTFSIWLLTKRPTSSLMRRIAS